MKLLCTTFHKNFLDHFIKKIKINIKKTLD